MYWQKNFIVVSVVKHIIYYTHSTGLHYVWSGCSTSAPVASWPAEEACLAGASAAG